MSRKRLTDCNKWADPWFMELPPEMKLLWIYLCDNCDNAGVWIVNHRLAEVQVGCPIEWSLAINVLEGRVSVIAEGKKWWLVKFVSFQHPAGLDEDNAPQRQVVACMKQHGLDSLPYMKSRVGGRVGSTLGTRDKYNTTPSQDVVFGGSAEGGTAVEPRPVAANRERLAKFAKSKRLSGSPDSIEELIGLARDMGCKGIDETLDMLNWSVDQAREKPGSDVRFARHFEHEARIWAKMKRETERITKESA